MTVVAVAAIVSMLFISSFSSDSIDSVGFAAHAVYPSFSAPESRFTINGNVLSVSDTAIYKTGYYSINGANWQNFTISGTILSGNWLTGTATYILPSFGSGESYVVIYSCTKNVSSWNCHDGTVGRWQLQIINTTKSGNNEITIQTPNHPYIAEVSTNTYDITGGTLPQWTIDGNLSDASRWSGEGDGAWIKYTFKNNIQLTGLNMWFYKSNTRIARFTLDYSNDDNAWTKIGDYSSSGTAVTFETFSFPVITAKYFRITGHGNTEVAQQNWTSIIEVQFINNTQTPCTPSCAGKQCGSDGCGTNNNCGTCSSGTGKTYYLAPNGKDSYTSTQAQNPATPWFTLEKAWTAIQPGDTVYLRGGTYRYTSEQNLDGVNGADGNLINIWAYPSDATPPIITRTTLWDSSPNQAGIWFQGDYFHWKGIEITGFTQDDSVNYMWYSFVAEYANHNIFELFNIHHNGMGFNIGHGSTDNLILNCDFHNNYDPITGPDPYGNSDGIGFNTDLGTTTIVQGCRSWANSDDGYDSFGSKGFILFNNSWAWANGYREDGITKGGDGNGFKLGGSFSTDPINYPTTHLRTISNCLAFDNREGGFDQNTGHFISWIYNNVGYHNAAGPNADGSQVWNLNFQFAEPTSNPQVVHELKNNIAFGNQHPSNVQANYDNCDEEHNTWDDGFSVSSDDFLTVDSTGVDDPRNADGSLPDLDFLKLRSDSPLIDAGVEVGLSYNGDAPDLGAFESSGTTTPPSCNPTCSNSHGTTSCSSSGTCRPSCSSGYDDCDGNTANGCETQLGTTSNCGSCGDACSSGTCNGGVCGSSSKTTLTIEGKTVYNTDDTWSGVYIPRDTPTNFIYRNNRIDTTSTYGYMLQAGDESAGPTNNMLDGEIISGNYFYWHGTNLYGSVHGIFTGYQKDAIIKYNYLDNVPMGAPRKGWGMANTPGAGGGLAYNIFKNNGLVSIPVKGMKNVNIYNNVFYSDQHMYVGVNDGTWRGFIDIYRNTDQDPPSDYSIGTKIKNNIFYTKHQIYNIDIYESGDLTGFESDYNIFYCEDGPPIFSYYGATKTFAEWQALGYDTHSIVLNPNFIDTVNFVPHSRLNYGTNLGTTWQTGLSTTATWTVGSSPTTTNQNDAWQVGARIY